MLGEPLQDRNSLLDVSITMQRLGELEHLVAKVVVVFGLCSAGCDYELFYGLNSSSSVNLVLQNTLVILQLRILWKGVV